MLVLFALPVLLYYRRLLLEYAGSMVTILTLGGWFALLSTVTMLNPDVRSAPLLAEVHPAK